MWQRRGSIGDAHDAMAGSDNGQGGALQERIGVIKGHVEQSLRKGTPAHEVEQGRWEQVLKLGREALGLYFSLQDTGDEGETVRLADVEQGARPSGPRGLGARLAKLETPACRGRGRTGHRRQDHHHRRPAEPAQALEPAVNGQIPASGRYPTQAIEDPVLAGGENALEPPLNGQVSSVGLYTSEALRRQALGG